MQKKEHIFNLNKWRRDFHLTPKKIAIYSIKMSDWQRNETNRNKIKHVIFCLNFKSSSDEEDVVYIRFDFNEQKLKTTKSKKQKKNKGCSKLETHVFLYRTIQGWRKNRKTSTKIKQLVQCKKMLYKFINPPVHLNSIAQIFCSNKYIKT